MEPFEFLAPESVGAALQALESEGAVALAGGTATVVMMKQNLMAPSRVVWLGRVAALRGIEATADGGLAIGAGTTLGTIERSPLVASACPALASAAAGVGNPRVRAVATMGGNLVHADPSQDLPPLLLALGAQASLVGPDGERVEPLASFFVDYMQTAVGERELVTRVTLPPPAAGTVRRASYTKFTPRSQDDFATVGVACRLDLDAEGRVADAAIALGGVAQTPVLVPAAAEALRGRRPGAADVREAAEAAVRASDPWDDQRGSAAYKRAMARVWTRRTVEALLAS